MSRENVSPVGFPISEEEFKTLMQVPHIPTPVILGGNQRGFYKIGEKVPVYWAEGKKRVTAEVMGEAPNPENPRQIKLFLLYMEE